MKERTSFLTIPWGIQQLVSELSIATMGHLPVYKNANSRELPRGGRGGGGGEGSALLGMTDA